MKRDPDIAGSPLHTANLVSVSQNGQVASGIFRYRYGSTTESSIFNMLKIQ